MITVPAMIVQQFGVTFYQAALSVHDIRKLVRFETLSYSGGRAERSKGKKKSRVGVNWGELEQKIGASEGSFQRPILHKKIEELVAYYRERHEHLDLAPIPGAVILVADRRLDFSPTSPRSLLGFLQLPEEDGLLRTLDGQHRLLALAAYADADGARADVAEALKVMSVPAIVFDGLPPSHAVEMFVTINTKHTRLKKDVIISLSGRKLYKEERYAAAHDVVRSLNERQDSPLCGDIRILGVGQGKVSRAPLASEIEALFRNQEAVGEGAARKFREQAREFFLSYFNLVQGIFLPSRQEYSLGVETTRVF